VIISDERLLWPEAVFHVLAHSAVPAGLPSSVYAPRYVRWCAEQLGPGEARELAQDAAALATQLDSHAQLAAVQALAWLFHSAERAQRCADRPLAELSAAEVDRPALLAHLRGSGAPAELLFCAACLELPALRRLPEPAFDPGLPGALARLLPAAPGLAKARIAFVRPLGFCGRVYGGEIWLGTPLDDGLPGAEHGAMQAAHEATVSELSARAGGRLAERDVEHGAIVLLAERCRAAGLAAEHTRWFEGLSAAPPSERSALPSAVRDLLD
jgi:hypothetical protein